MAEELDTIIAEADKKAAQASGATKTPEQIKAEDAKKAEDHLANINKAIAEANNILKQKRAAIKGDTTVEEKILPKIDLEDPNSAAWEKHFNGKVDPLKGEMEKEKEEVRTFALRRFLKDKPNLAKNPDGVKRVMETYEKIKTASERTEQGVLLDLDRAYAAEFHAEILEGGRQERMEEVAGDVIFSDPAISRGSTSIRTERDKAPRLSKDDEAILAKWGMTPEQWVKDKKTQDEKVK